MKQIGFAHLAYGLDNKDIIYPIFQPSVNYTYIAGKGQQRGRLFLSIGRLIFLII